LADSRRRIEQIRRLQIFDEEQYFREVYMPVLESLGVSRREIRDRVLVRKGALDASAR
jgi:acyl-[acyl-carrier-protein] desaturase